MRPPSRHQRNKMIYSITQILIGPDSKHVQPNCLPTRAVDYAEDRAVARVAFLCDNKKQCDYAADALRKALERRAVDNAIFTSDYRQRDTILEAMDSVRCHF